MSRGTIIVCEILLLIYMSISCEAGGANFLGIQRRFNDSAYYDSYYSCSTCGGGDLVWLVNGNTELAHFSSSRVGDVEFQRSVVDSSSRYTSVILSLRNSGNGVCRDVLMIATQTQSDWRPEVICRGSMVQYIVQYDTPMMAPLSEIHDRLVTLRYAIDDNDIVSLGNNYATHILVCRSRNEKVIWQKQGRFLAGFNGDSLVGDKEFSAHSTDPSIVKWEAVVLKKAVEIVTSALLYTDRDAVGTVAISCDSEQGMASTMVNIAAASTTVTTSNIDYSGVKIEEKSTSQVFRYVSLSPVSASIPVSTYFPSVMLSMTLAVVLAIW